MNESEVPGGRVRRVAPLVGLAGRTAGEAVVASLRNRRHGEVDQTEFHTRRAQRYAERLGNSRGVLMKAGQILSLVTLEPTVDAPYRGIYQAAFARLQDDAPPMPPKLAVDTITAELGRSPWEAFAQFDPRPLAAASIGQVHAATLPDGRRVAVKVQYPGVAEAIRADLKNTELLATFLQLVLTLAPGLARADVRDMAREVAERIGEEVDYRAEAANQREFADRYRGHPFIRIPEVLPELSTGRVLTMELSDGVRYAKALAGEQSLRERWGEAIFRFVFANLSRGLFNADPHPGNYLFHPDGSVTFLDFGCVKRFTAAQVRHMDDLVQAVVDRNPAAVLEAAVAAAMVDPTNPPDAEALCAALADTGVRPLVAPQPFTYTPEFAAQVLHEFNPRGVHGPVLRKIRGAGDYVFISRIDTGLTAVLAGLRASGPFLAIRAEYYRGEHPATPYGELEAAHRRARR